jgi:hypothetical protein
VAACDRVALNRSDLQPHEAAHLALVKAYNSARGGDLASALDLVGEAARETEKNPEIHSLMLGEYAVMRAHLETDKSSRAQAVQEALSSKSLQPESFILLATVAAADDDLDLLGSVASAAINAYPVAPDAWEMAGQVALSIEGLDSNRAMLRFSRAFALGGRPSALPALLFRNGQTSEADETLAAFTQQILRGRATSSSLGTHGGARAKALLEFEKNFARTQDFAAALRNSGEAAWRSIYLQEVMARTLNAASLEKLPKPITFVENLGRGALFNGIEDEADKAETVIIGGRAVSVERSRHSKILKRVFATPLGGVGDAGRTGKDDIVWPLPFDGGRDLSRGALSPGAGREALEIANAILTFGLAYRPVLSFDVGERPDGRYEMLVKSRVGVKATLYNIDEQAVFAAADHCLENAPDMPGIFIDERNRFTKRQGTSYGGRPPVNMTDVEHQLSMIFHCADAGEPGVSINAVHQALGPKLALKPGETDRGRKALTTQ